MSWLLLVLGGLFEVGFTFCLGKIKEASGNEMYLWILGFIISVSASMYLLFKASENLPIGTAYAVWTGIGAVGTILMGVLFFQEPTNFWRLFFIFTLVASIIGLKVVAH